MSKEKVINELSKLSGRKIALFFHVVDAIGKGKLYSYVEGVFRFFVVEKSEQIKLCVGDANFYVYPNQISQIQSDIITVYVED